jgi:hypothetical protein
MKSWKAALGLLVAGLVAFLALFRKKQVQTTPAEVEQKAQVAKTQTEERLENTPADSLVADDPVAVDRRSQSVGSISSDLRQRIRDRVNSSGQTDMGSGSPGGSGNGPDHR